MIAMFTASCKDDIDHTIITPEQLPKDAITFLEKYFPGNNIIGSNKYNYDSYSATLTDGAQDILVGFNGKGEWEAVTAPNGLPQTARKIIYDRLDNFIGVTEDFDSYYGNQKITKLYNDLNEEIKFVLDEKFISHIIYTNEGWTYADAYVNERYELPQKLINFIKGDFRSTSSRDVGPQPKLLRFEGFRGYIYRFVISQETNTYIDFYEDGEWFCIEDKASLLQNHIANMGILPESIYTTLKDNFEGAEENINTVTRFNNGTLYGVKYQENKFALISKDNEIIEPPLDEAKAYIESGFNPTEELEYDVRQNTGGAYYLRYAFIATSESSKILLITDFEGKMRSISAGPITNDEKEIVPLTEAILNTMPKAALDYINENHPDSPIIGISYNHSKDHDDISEEFSFAIHIPNNLKYISFNSVSGEYISEFNVLPNN